MSRRRPLSIAAVFAIVVISVFGGPLSASAAIPSAITFDTPLSGSDTSLYAAETSGTFGEPLTVDTIVSVRSQDEGFTEYEICQVLVPAGATTWTCQATLRSGAQRMYALAYDPTDPVINISSPGWVDVVNWGTEALVVSSPAASSTTFDPTPTFTGTGPRKGDVIVFDGGEAICTATVSRDGDWSCTPTDDLGYGAHSITVESTFYDGSAGTQASVPLEVAIPPAPAVTHAIGPATLATTVTGDPASGVGIDLYEYSGIESMDFVTGCPDAGGEYAFGGPTVTCDFGVLTPNVYLTDAGQRISNYDSARQIDYFRIPVAPTLTATAGTASVTISGSATTGDTVRVTDESGSQVCAVVAAGGSWSCFVTAPAGAHTYSALSVDAGATFRSSSDGPVESMAFLGLSARSASVSVTVIAPAVVAKPAAKPTPTPTPTPLVFTANFGWDGDELHPGDSTVLTGDGAPAGSLVDVELHSTPIALGSTTAADDGTFSIPVTIPLDIEPGDHHFVVFVTPVGEARAQFEQSVAITALPDAVEAETDTDDDDEPAASTVQTTGSNRNDLSEPTSFTTSLATFPELLAEILSNPAALGGAGLAAIALLLFVGFPAELLNATFSEQYGRFTRGLPGDTGLLGRVKAWFIRTPVLGGIGITFAAAFLFGFVDPSFGFDLASLRTVLACALALFFVGFFSSALTGFIVKRRWSIPNVIELKPLGLILTVVGVVMSRVLDFSPGFLIGLILGLSLAASATVAQEAKASLIRAGIIFVLAVGAWIVYSIVMATGGTDSPGGTFALDVLVATTGEGMTALLIGLLPFRFLDGESVFKHSKLWWAISWGLSALAFLVIIVPSSWGEINGSLILWIVILGGFGLVALGLYLYFRFWAPKVPEEEPETRNAETHEVTSR